MQGYAKVCKKSPTENIHNVKVHKRTYQNINYLQFTKTTINYIKKYLNYIKEFKDT